MLKLGAQIAVSGGYDYEPEWLAERSEVTGYLLKWIPGQNATPACVVHLDEPLTATGLVRGKRQSRTGSYLVLELRYVGQQWEPTGTVHVELCETEPEDKSWADRQVGAWVESHATYLVPTWASDASTPTHSTRQLRSCCRPSVVPIAER